jgi:transcriptional regulator with PAS, ATPase and Fis domain
MRKRFLARFEKPLKTVKLQLFNITHAKPKGNLTYNSLPKLLEKTEKDTIKKALELTSGNRTSAAKMLHIHRSTLYKKMGKLDLIL